jgi:hypothetical protein
MPCRACHLRNARELIVNVIMSRPEQRSSSEWMRIGLQKGLARNNCLRCPLLALSRHGSSHCICPLESGHDLSPLSRPLLGVNRTQRFALQMSAFDQSGQSISQFTRPVGHQTKLARGGIDQREILSLSAAAARGAHRGASTTIVRVQAALQAVALRPRQVLQPQGNAAAEQCRIRRGLPRSDRSDSWRERRTAGREAGGSSIRLRETERPLRRIR